MEADSSQRRRGDRLHAAPVRDAAMILCDPLRLPLPVLYHHACHPHSTAQLPYTLCDERRRSVPRALASLQQRYVPNLAAGELQLRPSPYTPDEIDNLLWLQDELTDEVLDRYYRVAPGALERRAARLQRAFLARRAV